MSWTQPMCRGCWNIREPNRDPHVLRDAEPEVCCICGCTTLDGIYVRIDPATVPYPATDEEEQT